MTLWTASPVRWVGHRKFRLRILRAVLSPIITIYMIEDVWCGEKFEVRNKPLRFSNDKMAGSCRAMLDRTAGGGCHHTNRLRLPAGNQLQTVRLQNFGDLIFRVGEPGASGIQLHV